MTNRNLEMLGRLLEYPREDFQHVVDSSCDLLSRDLDEEEAAMLMWLQSFRSRLQTLTVGETQELYTRTFDLNPTCSLDLGWHLYAENYDRGTFLVHMREQLRKHGIEEAQELPDHLPSVLNLLARTEENAASALATSSVLPALRKMLAGFSDRENPYFSLLRVVQSMLTARYQQGVERHG